jgi:hypothetical protein
MQFVTVPHAEFRTELVVSLYSGWIVQLVIASLAWHAHKPLLAICMVWVCAKRPAENTMRNKGVLMPQMIMVPPIRGAGHLLELLTFNI